MKTFTVNQLRNAYEYLIAHGRGSINEARLSSLVETADTWNKNGRRDCFVTGDLSVEVKKVPDGELKPFYREAVRIVEATFPEQCSILVEACVRIRMLKPSELAAAHSFPSDYILTGNRGDQVKQIGNSVPVMTAAAMCECDLRKVS